MTKHDEKPEPKFGDVQEETRVAPEGTEPDPVNPIVEAVSYPQPDTVPAPTPPNPPEHPEPSIKLHLENGSTVEIAAKDDEGKDVKVAGSFVEVKRANTGTKLFLRSESIVAYE